MESIGTAGRQDPDLQSDLRSDAPLGGHDETNNSGRKTEVGEYKRNQYSQATYRTIFQKVSSPGPKVFVSTPEKTVWVHKPTAALGFTSTPLCPRHLAPLKLHHKTFRPVGKVTLKNNS